MSTLIDTEWTLKFVCPLRLCGRKKTKRYAELKIRVSSRPSGPSVDLLTNVWSSVVVKRVFATTDSQLDYKTFKSLRWILNIVFVEFA
jgi:hypothetical protein